MGKRAKKRSNLPGGSSNSNPRNRLSFYSRDATLAIAREALAAPARKLRVQLGRCGPKKGGYIGKRGKEQYVSFKVAFNSCGDVGIFLYRRDFHSTAFDFCAYEENREILGIAALLEGRN